MSKLYSPFPPQNYNPDFLPRAQWWRYRMRRMNEHGHIYVITLGPCTHKGVQHDNGPLACPDNRWITWEWFDGFDTILDAGLDTPNVAAMALTNDDLVEYVDLLTDHQPTPSPDWCSITAPGERTHPEIPNFPRSTRMRFA